MTSHQFRHNGITDRLKAGFTLPQIAELTAHHGTAMLYASYTHLNLFPETIVEPIKYQTEAENPYVLFGGKILNIDAVTESRLLKNIRAHRVPGGVCADVTHCRSGIWNCVDCEYFVPEVEQLLYFKEQVAAWGEKTKKFQGDKQMADNFRILLLDFKELWKNWKVSTGMKKNKTIPKELAERQELQRQHSINLVLRAIEDIKAEDRKITITILMEFTGLSRSVFSKGHIRELLVDYGYAEQKSDGLKRKANKDKEVNVLEEKDRKIRELQILNKELQRECELLRGRLFLLMQK